MEGWQLWDLVLRCGSQVRTAGLGSVVGFDHAAFFRMAEQLGYDRQAVALWLPVIENALVEAIREQQDDGDTQGNHPVVGEGR